MVHFEIIYFVVRGDVNCVHRIQIPSLRGNGNDLVLSAEFQAVAAVPATHKQLF